MNKNSNVTILEEKIENGEKITRMLIDGTSITVRRPLIPKEEDVIRVYDVCNKLFKDHPECFYTPEQTKEKNRLIAMQKGHMQ